MCIICVMRKDEGRFLTLLMRSFTEVLKTLFSGLDFCEVVPWLGALPSPTLYTLLHPDRWGDWRDVGVASMCGYPTDAPLRSNHINLLPNVVYGLCTKHCQDTHSSIVHRNSPSFIMYIVHIITANTGAWSLFEVMEDRFHYVSLLPSCLYM